MGSGGMWEWGVAHRGSTDVFNGYFEAIPNGRVSEDEGPHQPNHCIQFIDIAICLDSRRVFGDLCPVNQSCVAAIAGTGVDLCDSHISSVG